jgi:hypothetical protein
VGAVLLLVAGAWLTSACSTAASDAPTYTRSPFKGKWIEVAGLHDLVTWSDVHDAPPAAPTFPLPLSGVLTDDGVLSCAEVSSVGVYPTRHCDYYKRVFDPVTGPSVEYVGTTQDQVVAVQDLDGDGTEDWVTYGLGIQWGGWQTTPVASTMLPGGVPEQPAIFSPDGDGRMWIVAAASPGDPAGRVVDIYRQQAAHGHTFEDASSLLGPGTTLQTNAMSAHCLPWGDCYIAAAGWAQLDPSAGVPVQNVFLRTAGQESWSLFTPPDDVETFESGSPMGALWEDSSDTSRLYVTTKPVHYLYTVRPGGVWETTPLAWALVPSPNTGQPQIAWGMKLLEIDGLPTVCMAHGFDDPTDVTALGAISSETANCFSRSPDGAWVERTDPVLNATGGQPGVALADQVWGQFRYVDDRVDSAGRIWLTIDSLAGYGVRHPRLLVYEPAP